RILVALGALVLGTTAFAQTAETQVGQNTLAEAAIGFGFRLGAYFPAESSLRRGGTAWVDFGVEYDFERSMFRNGTTYASLDWNSPKFLGGEHFMTLGINQRFYTSHQRYAPSGTSYFYLGVGAGFLHHSGSDDSTWMVRGGVGVEMQQHYFLEVGGTLSPKIGGANPSGVSASIGYRFK
ncbi:MAG: hypothetical protein QOJ65_993, partial [Fimbriimonadaceae bacterium]|nr:hypothetical protein [Fimbriimonadaceae bacterium]